MVKKSGSFTDRLTDGELATSILESANQIWLAGLGAFAVAQEEGSKAFDTFVKEGEAVQKRAKKVAGEKLDEVKDKATDAWDKLEDVFEGRVAQALRSLSVPHKKDIDVLAKRVAALTEAVEELSAKTTTRAKPPVHVVAAKPRVAKTPPAATHS
jgi:poly(hydroxyalkanoate) granule-associated protein